MVVRMRTMVQEEERRVHGMAWLASSLYMDMDVGFVTSPYIP